MGLFTSSNKCTHWKNECKWLQKTLGEMTGDRDRCLKEIERLREQTTRWHDLALKYKNKLIEIKAFIDDELED